MATGGRVAAATTTDLDGGSVTISDTSRSEVRVLSRYSGQVAVRGDGRVLVISTFERNAGLIAYDSAPAEPRRLATFGSFALAVAFSRDGSMLGVASQLDEGPGTRLELWEMTTRRHRSYSLAADSRQVGRWRCGSR